MSTTRRILLSLLLAGLPFAPPHVRADDKDDAAERARGILRAYCRACHAGPADRLKGDLAVFDHKQLLRRKAVRPGKPEESELFQLVACGSMPPGELPKPGPAEVDALRDWIAGGAADFPPEYGEIYVMKKIQKDLAGLDAKDMPYQRYVSFNHLLADDDAADPSLWRDALLKVVNHLSWQSDPVPVTPIDPPVNTIFRVDERKLGWDAQPFEATDPTDPMAVPSASRVDLFDLLLLEYPYAALPSRFGGEQKVLADYLKRANPVRPILYVRGDWLVSTATQPPLYEDLLRLPRTLAGLEEKVAVENKPARAAFADSHVSKLPQLVERRGASAGAYWRTFELGKAKDLKGLLREAADAGRGGMMLFTLPNGLNGYYIAKNVPDVGGKRLTRLAAAAQKEWGADPLASDQVARNGLSCMRCHTAGLQTFTDTARPALDDLPPAEKNPLLALFPGKEAMDRLLADDIARFRKAVQAVHGGPLDREPLTPVTTRFLQGAHAAPVLPALLDGGSDPATPAAAAGDRERPNPVHFPEKDMDAPPLPPLDGLTLQDYRPPLPPADVTLTALDAKTRKPTTTFLPGDQMVIEATNQGKDAVYIELIGVSVDGHMIVHQPPRKLAAGETYHYPKERPIKPKEAVDMLLPPGVDRYLLFAADREFPAGVRLRSKDKAIADRVVHPFWTVSPDGSQVQVQFDPSHLVKKTLAVETCEP